MCICVSSICIRLSEKLSLTMANSGRRRPPPLELGDFRSRIRRDLSPRKSPCSTSSNAELSSRLRELDPRLPEVTSERAGGSPDEIGSGLTSAQFRVSTRLCESVPTPDVSASPETAGKPEFPSLLRSSTSRFSMKRLSLWAFETYNFFTTRCLLPIRLYAANRQALLLYAFLVFGRIVEFIFHFAACVVPAFFYVFFAMFLNLVTVSPHFTASPSTPGRAASPSLSEGDVAASQLDAAVDSLVWNASRSTVKSHLSGVLRVASDSTSPTAASSAGAGVALSAGAGASFSDMPPRVFQRSVGGPMPGGLPVPRAGGERREGGTANSAAGTPFGTQAPPGRGEEATLSSIGLTYVYFVISQVCRGLLLEVPLYTFSLYFAQLLHMQSLTFSLSPQCRQAAEISAAYYNQSPRAVTGVSTNQRSAAAISLAPAAPAAGAVEEDPRVETRDEGREQVREGRGAEDRPRGRSEGDRPGNRLQLGESAADAEPRLREPREEVARDGEGRRPASPRAEGIEEWQSAPGGGTPIKGNKREGCAVTDEDETSAVVSSSLQTLAQGPRNALRSRRPVWERTHCLPRAGEGLDGGGSRSCPSPGAFPLSRNQPVAFTQASDSVNGAAREIGSGERERLRSSDAETPSCSRDTRGSSSDRTGVLPAEDDVREPGRVSGDSSAEPPRPAEMGEAREPSDQEGEERISPSEQRLFFVPVAAVRFFVRLMALVGVSRLVRARGSSETRERARRRSSQIPPDANVPPRGNVLAGALPVRVRREPAAESLGRDARNSRETACRDLGRIVTVLNTLHRWREGTWKGSRRRLAPCLGKIGELLNRIRAVWRRASGGRLRCHELLRQMHPYRLLSVSPLVFFPSASQRLFFTTFFFWLLRCIYEDGAEDAVAEDAWTFLVSGGNVVNVAASFNNYSAARLAGLSPRYYSAFSSYLRNDAAREAAKMRPTLTHPFVTGFAGPFGGMRSFSLARQWTVWWALVLLGMLFISYSLLAVFSAFGVLPWQLLHSLLVLRHTRVATYAQRRERETRERREKRRKQWEALHESQAACEQGAVTRPGSAAEVREDEPGGEVPLDWTEHGGIRRRRYALWTSPNHKDAGVFTFGDDEEEEEICIFCFEVFKSEDILRVVNSCGHKFHRHCVDVWLFKRQKETCPMCGQLRSPRLAK
ncbi:zinc finger, C3HC4 type (RING finger) domain-containing protein [Toxoplasma gondii RUB]|uniref:Zinc finger, C3HC4 type (RING finger) domain-containing protein n=1 Tax=Toxoplasma gondii RUB TaxID=935652 RepID=A0A086M212_TOXGO|nr:zinc finger, C3HC4 type (RING finger) domain-containing protein [Toxoplasma gondii RUB]